MLRPDFQEGRSPGSNRESYRVRLLRNHHVPDLLAEIAESSSKTFIEERVGITLPKTVTLPSLDEEHALSEATANQINVLIRQLWDPKTRETYQTIINDPDVHGGDFRTVWEENTIMISPPDTDNDIPGLYALTAFSKGKPALQTLMQIPGKLSDMTEQTTVFPVARYAIFHLPEGVLETCVTPDGTTNEQFYPGLQAAPIDPNKREELPTILSHLDHEGQIIASDHIARRFETLYDGNIATVVLQKLPDPRHLYLNVYKPDGTWTIHLNRQDHSDIADAHSHFTNMNEGIQTRTYVDTTVPFAADENEIYDIATAGDNVRAIATVMAHPDGTLRQTFARPGCAFEMTIATQDPTLKPTGILNGEPIQLMSARVDSPTSLLVQTTKGTLRIVKDLQFIQDIILA